MCHGRLPAIILGLDDCGHSVCSVLRIEKENRDFAGEPAEGRQFWYEDDDLVSVKKGLGDIPWARIAAGDELSEVVPGLASWDGSGELWNATRPRLT